MTPIPFDGLGTFLVFLIGVPALILQSLTPELRRVVGKRGNLIVQVGLPIAFGVLAIAWGIYVHTTSGAAADTFAFMLWNLPAELLWVIVLVVLFGSAVWTAIVIPYQFGRPEVIVKNLQQRIVKTWRKQGRLDDVLLQDLIQLGEQSAPGNDKQLVLEAMYGIADEVCRDPIYRGDALESVINGLDGILATDGRRGDTKNFGTAADILERIATGIGARNATELPWVDLGYTIHMLSELSRRAIEQMERTNDIEKTLMKCVQSLQLAVSAYPTATMEVSEALFKIGAAGIERDQPLAATAALEKLFALVEANRPASGELVADTLGLAAHFWCAGSTARGYVSEKLVASAVALEFPLCEALQAAREHCRRTTQFQAADHLEKMLAELGESAIVMTGAPS